MRQRPRLACPGAERPDRWSPTAAEHGAQYMGAGQDEAQLTTWETQATDRSSIRASSGCDRPRRRRSAAIFRPSAC